MRMKQDDGCQIGHRIPVVRQCLLVARKRCRGGFLDVFSDRWQGLPEVLEGLEDGEQDVDCPLPSSCISTPSRGNAGMETNRFSRRSQISW